MSQKIDTIKLEEIIKNSFSTLLEDDKYLQINVVLSHGKKWAGCLKTTEWKAVLIETDNNESPFIKIQDVKPLKGNVGVEYIQRSIKNQTRNFIAFYCRKESLSELFFRVAADIIYYVIHECPEKTDPFELICARLQEWKVLFASSDIQAEEKGLLGELYLYKQLQEHCGLNPMEWMGASGGTKDFMLKGINLEVKTTSVRHGYYVHISSIFQPNNPVGIAGKLIFLRIEAAPNGDYSVLSLIKKIKQKMNKSELETFEDKLSSYDDSTINSNNLWSFIEDAVIDMDEKFPRITSDSFVNKRIPEGIKNISYIVDLTALKKQQLNDFITEMKNGKI